VSVSSRSEDARSFYQQRLALTFKVGFALSAAFLVGNLVASQIVSHDLAAGLRTRSFHLAATVILGVVWWWLRRGRLSYRSLLFCDTALVVFLSLLFSISAGLYEVRAVSVYQLGLVPGLVAVIRAVVVPSTAGRTLWLGLVGAAFATAVFFLSAFHPSWPVEQHGETAWPLPYQLAAFTLWLGALISVATVASRVIYQLRGEVRAARKLGQYVLGERLGEGGMGVVYQATHALLRRETALKLLPPDRVDAATIKRFEREVVETARLRHPSTVAIYDYGRTPDGVFYYAMEFLDGLTLGELLACNGPQPANRVAYLLAQVCASLDEAHGMGLVHRDIKPANVMIIGHTAAYDLVKVLDFGLVKSLAPLDGGVSLTNADHLTGTPLYMAPEAIAHPDAAEPRSDLYAVAAIGYYLLTGHHVFEGASAVEIYAAHLHATPVAPHVRLGAHVPPSLEALILRGLAKSPENRPASAAAFREALLRLDLPPWTEEDARAWWRTHGDRARRCVMPQSNLDAPTVTVVRDRAELVG
jgi:eukaryotic-like serine/threonine-protein kinase